MEKNLIQGAKKLAAFKAVDDFVKNNIVLGIGSGTTILHVISRLVERINNENLNVICVPTSYQARKLILDNNLRLGDLDTYPKIDVTIDGADEVDSNLNLIKGGGGCLLQEKMVAFCSSKLVIVADYTKNSQYLGETYKKGIPIEVIPLAHEAIKQKILNKFGGEITLRDGIAKAGPCVTDNGNFILDWTDFNTENVDWKLVNQEIKLLPGVVEIGLFINMAHVAIFGLENGEVLEKKSPNLI